MSLKTAVESLLRSRLTAYDPSLDTSEGSTIDIEVVQPVIARLGTFPLDTDVRSFIKARINENYPDIYTEAELEDLFINPLETILEPIILEESTVQISQSFVNKDLMADEEVDDLAANSFVERNEGGFSTGFVRVYYNAPTSLVITTEKQITSKSGLIFFPSVNFEISAAQMLLNREGFLFYVDIPVIAENPGQNYDIDVDQILSIDDLKNPVKVTNKNKFSGGDNRETTDDLVLRAEESRTEQSLNTKRGAIARTTDLFSDVKTMQVVGSGEVGMERDLLTGNTDGLVYLAFTGGIFGNWAFIDYSVRYKNPAFSIDIGDKIKFVTTTFGNPQEALVTSIFFTNTNIAFIELDQNFPTLYGQAIDGVLIKPGFITVSKVPEGSFSATVPSNQIHLYGYSDVYVAPNTVEDQSVNVNNVTSETQFFSTVTGNTINGSNAFSTSPVTDFLAIGVLVGDLLTVETGGDTGTYKIIQVTTTEIRLDRLLTATTSNIHARIRKGVDVTYTNPKEIKLPYSGTISDLSTTNGSSLFVTTVDTQTFNVTIGDTVEVLTGNNKGLYIITGFDGILGGRGLIVDKPAPATETNIAYRIYTSKQGIVPPFLRIRDIELLDNVNQGTGKFIPYGDFVDIRAKCEFEAVKTEETVLERKLFFLPSQLGFSLTPNPATPGPGVDARYTQRLESYDGILKQVSALGTNPITSIEINVPPFVYDNKRSSVLVLVSKKDLQFLTDPFGNPQTSPVAEAKKDYVLTIKNNVNGDSYLVRDIRVLSLWGQNTNGHYAIALAQIDGEFRFDPVANLFALIDFGIISGSGVAALTEADYMKIFQYSTNWFNALGFLESVLIQRTFDTLNYLGFIITISEVREFVIATCMASYSIGEAPEGELRCYAKEPVTSVFYTTPHITNNNPGRPSSTEFLELLAYNSKVPRKRAKIKSDLEFGQILPVSSVKTQPSQWLRIESQKYPASQFLYLTSGESFISRGVREGDRLEFYSAINDYSSRGIQESSYLLVTVAGSNVVRFIWPTSRNNITPLTAGQLLFIDTGPDLGMYTIIEVLSDTAGDYRVKIDKTLTHTTLTYPIGVSFGPASAVSGSNVINDINLSSVNPSNWLTVYAATSTGILTAGDDRAYLGSFALTGVGLGFATLNRTAFFPANASVLWVEHAPPAVVPTATTGGGTEISTQFVRGRLYSNTVETRDITIDWTVTPNPINNSSKEQIKLNTSLTTNGSLVNFSHKSPFRIIRRGVFIVSSTEMQNFRENGLYYTDIPVVALGTSSEFFFLKNTPFSIGGAFDIEGYTITPDNNPLTFSTKETGILKLPNAFLPAGAEYNFVNYVNTSGQGIKINYDAVSLIAAIQQFYDSPQDRIACANMLVKAMLPAYPYIEIQYVSGRDTTTVANAIFSYIHEIPADNNQISVDELIEIVKKNLASKVDSPLLLVAIVHGNDRKLRTLRSQDSIGFLDTPIYRGDPNTIIFYPGKDVSTETSVPNLEYIKLTRS